MRNRPGKMGLGIGLLLGMATAGVVQASEMVPPPREHWSANRKFVLRVEDNFKKRFLTLLRAKVSSETALKEAMRLRSRPTLTLLHVTGQDETPVWSVQTPLNGRGFPRTVHIRDDGRYVVLGDHPADLVQDKALVFLGEQGQELGSYSLKALFSEEEIRSLRREDFDLLWWNQGTLRFIPGRDQFGFITSWGALGLFDLTTGKRLSLHAPEADSFRQEALQLEREALKKSHPLYGVLLAGVLQDREAVPTLKQLLTRLDDYYQTPLKAGRALVCILGQEAAPMLEERVSNAEPSTARDWIELMQQTGMAAQSKGVLKWVQSSNLDIRFRAIVAISENGGAEVVRRHPEWLTDRSEQVSLLRTESLRLYPVRCLAWYGDARDIPLLLSALNDRDDSVSRLALRGLIRLKPSDLVTILHRYLKRAEARIALADLGDAAQLRWCVTQLEHWPDEKGEHVSDPKSGAAIGLAELPEVVKVLVRHRPPGTEAALRSVAQTPGDMFTAYTRFAAVGLGGLAALGDKPALKQVREIAATAEVFSAVEAIEWLAFANDRESVPLFRSLREHKEEKIRNAARRALETLEKESQPPANLSGKMQRTNHQSFASPPFLITFLALGVLALGYVGYFAVRGRRR